MAEGDTPIERFTAAQQVEQPGNLSSAITGALAELQNAFPDQKIEALKWNATYVAVPLVVDVQLPSRGTVNGIDIRRREPVFLLLDRSKYPHKAPWAYSDRRDFPKSKLPHLNTTPAGTAACFCLHRGDINTWFAEHGIVDLVGRVRAWLRDAARDRLIPQRDKFEPTRGDTRGHIVYDPAAFLAERAAASGASGFRFVTYELLDEKAQAAIGVEGYAARAVPFSIVSIQEELSLATAFNVLAKKPEYQHIFAKRLFGVFIWAQADRIATEYFGELHETLGNLLVWADQRGFPLRHALADYLANDLHLFAGIPVTLAVRRPREVLNAQGDIELLNFIIVAGDGHWPKDRVWDESTPVWFTDHRIPLSVEFARQLSSHDRGHSIGRVLTLGCGALGSKICLHFARSGQTAMTLVDRAFLSPHNVVRHALGGRQIGKSKAQALLDCAVELYPGQSSETLGLTANSADAFDYLLGGQREELDRHNALIDATASASVFNMLVGAMVPPHLLVARTEIADRGKLGLISVEGKSRNPRLDDLQLALFDLSLTDDDVSGWLRAARHVRETEVGSGLEEIQVGVNCSSATMRLSDETVALHAAYASGRLRDSLSQRAEHGLIYRSVVGADGTVSSRRTEVDPVAVLTARNDPSWQVRLAAGLSRMMMDRLRKARPDENGGLLIGMVHSKRRVIYITRLLDAPTDSEGSPTMFFRGVDGLPEAVRAVEERSGGLLGYVGEWHTHPDGGPDLSAQDLVAVVGLKAQLDRVPMPTLVAVVTPRGVYPHVFSAGGDVLQMRNRVFRIIKQRR